MKKPVLKILRILATITIALLISKPLLADINEVTGADQKTDNSLHNKVPELCKKGSKTLAELIEERAHEDPYHLTQKELQEKTRMNSIYPVSDHIPSDVEIDPTTTHIVIIKPTDAHDYPDPKSGSSWGARPFLRENAVCRVKDSHDVWWYVIRGKEGDLHYIVERDAMPQKKFDEESKLYKQKIQREQQQRLHDKGESK